MTREEVQFESGGERRAAWLYRPDDDGPSPLVVMAGAFGPSGHERLGAFAERFAEAGIGALAFDDRDSGDSGGSPRQVLDIGRRLDDWRAAIAFARRLSGVDADRIGAWGGSLSGGHVVTLAAEDPAIATAVVQAPLTDGLLSLQALRRADRPRLRSVLRLAAYRPVRRAAQVRCPLLVCVADRDDLALREPAVRCAELAPRGEVRRYDAGRLDVDLGDTFERVVADQVGFLRRTLAVEAAAGTPVA